MSQELETPIIGYISRLQKQMDYVTMLLFNQGAGKGVIKRALRGLIANYPPNGKKELTKEYNKMLQDNILSDVEAEELYNKCHDWAYNHILQDAFRAKPQFKEKPHISVE